MTTTPPAAGLAKHLAFLAQHADLLAQHSDHITSIDISAYSTSILVRDEGTALDLAVALHVSGEPRRRPDDDKWHGFVREGNANGIDLRISSFFPATSTKAVA